MRHHKRTRIKNEYLSNRENFIFRQSYSFSPLWLIRSIYLTVPGSIVPVCILLLIALCTISRTSYSQNRISNEKFYKRSSYFTLDATIYASNETEPLSEFGVSFYKKFDCFIISCLIGLNANGGSKPRVILLNNKHELDGYKYEVELNRLYYHPIHNVGLRIGTLFELGKRTYLTPIFSFERNNGEDNIYYKNEDPAISSFRNCISENFYGDVIPNLIGDRPVSKFLLTLTQFYEFSGYSFNINFTVGYIEEKEKEHTYALVEYNPDDPEAAMASPDPYYRDQCTGPYKLSETNYNDFSYRRSETFFAFVLGLTDF